jgi:membrane protease YdiL (CAAX protease family)
MKTNSSPAALDMNVIRPISLAAVLAIFASTLAPILLGVYVLLPFLLGHGVPFFVGYLVCFQSLPFVFVLWLALHLYRKEGNGLTWQAFTRRMGLDLNRKTVLAGLGLFVLALVTYVALQPVSRFLAAQPGLAPPAWFGPDLHPLKSGSPGTFMGMAVGGAFWAPVLYLLGWFFNIAGEELLFRGYLLPRMELKFAGKAWLVNAACWWVWHVFWRWQLIALAPVIFVLPWVAQRTRSTVPGIIGHGMVNLIGVILVALMVFGLR